MHIISQLLHNCTSQTGYANNLVHKLTFLQLSDGYDMYYKWSHENCMNQACTHSLVSWNCFTKSVCVCMYTCIFAFLSVPTWTNILSIKAGKESLYYYVYAQVSSALKVGFFPELKPGVVIASSQTLRPAFLVNFSGILKLKTTVLHLVSIQGMRISLFGKWAWPTFTQTKMKSSLEALLEEFIIQ